MALRCLARLSLLAGAAALPTYDSEGNLQTDFFDRGVAPAAAGKSSHLKVMTFYGGTADELHGWANVMRDSIDACDNKTITEKWKMKILVELGADVFDRSKHALYPGWKNATDTFIATVKPHVASGKALGVFMGDEICCGGTPYSNLSSVAARLKAGLPDAWIYTNECSEMHSWPKLGADGSGGVPAGLDAISVDFYDEHNTDGAAEVAKNKDFYHKEIYPRLRPHQQGLFVPGVFASSPSHCIASNDSCPLDPQAKQIVIKLEGFFQWAKEDPKIAGFNPWHFSNRSGPQLHGGWDQRLGAVSMPTVVSKLQEIGKYISSQSKN